MKARAISKPSEALKGFDLKIKRVIPQVATKPAATVPTDGESPPAKPIVEATTKKARNKVDPSPQQ